MNNVLSFNEYESIHESKKLPETKLNKLLTYMRDLDKNNAIKLASTFFTGILKDEKATVEIAAECIKGRTSFYAAIGYDTNKIIDQAWEILLKNYGKQLEKF